MEDLLKKYFIATLKNHAYYIDSIANEAEENIDNNDYDWNNIIKFASEVGTACSNNMIRFFEECKKLEEEDNEQE